MPSSSALEQRESASRLSALIARVGAVRITTDVFAEQDAVKLQTAAIGSQRTDDETDVAELADLCARLPLALRIAAERAAARLRIRRNPSKPTATIETGTGDPPLPRCPALDERLGLAPRHQLTVRAAPWSIMASSVTSSGRTSRWI